MAKRTCGSPTRWHDTPVVMDVVRCMASALEVLAFLDALPTLSAPLAALRRLLLQDQRQWPTLALDALPDNCIDLALATLATLTQVQYAGSKPLDLARWPLALPQSVHLELYVHDADSSLVLDQWAPNVTTLHIHGSAVKNPIDVARVCSALKRCSNLSRVVAKKMVLPDVVGAIVSAALRVRSLAIHTASSSDTVAHGPVVDWLRSPTATTLCLSCGTTDDDAVLRALAASPALKHLALSCRSSLGRALSTAPRGASKRLLQLQLTSLELQGIMPTTNVASLLGHVNTSTIRKIVLACHTPRDLTDVWLRLHAFPELEEIALRRCQLRPPTRALQTNFRLRRVSLDFTVIPLELLGRLLSWLAAARCLQALVWTNSALSATAARMIANALPHLRQRGLVHLDLSSNLFDDGAAALLLTRLGDACTSETRPLTIHLGGMALDRDQLFQTLQTHHRVTLCM
ncbi:hypothetical protein SPRG_07881 [Saprolegnia parasitica CBS 223.65]|uniref:F-box domain-containing protein n=1 Tax=Saprolegnia parasitica (strain CBS 223.65) TaxID=695850 RepID=A0A067C7C4_SAPPC|nr:hypothetical protein SPRG_07881 [Saprolegnia parasitica CBS 223.65]KDO26659.1 hypothetical protein SPRG_07881 [Saprolegnia parasitica CBS 223.65]|eukprot:XP_012202543.1 hypothetical protein SPRG_07881 [Saprolegnia parasitica CBS 223.65]